MIKLRSSTISRLRDRLKETGARPSIVVSSAQDVLAKAGMLPAEEQAAVRSIDPVVEMMFLMMAADGDIGDVERTVIRGAVRELSENYVRSTTLGVMLGGYEDLLAAEGQQARLEDIASRLQDDVAGAESAFVLAAAVAFADEVVADQENDLLNTFADAVGLTEERANELLNELEQDWKENPE
jgi:uncharacterized protein (DUF1778 family)